MILAAIPWLNIAINLLLVVFVIVCLLMILLVLMQRPKQEGLGAAFGGGVTDQMFGARTTNVLQRGTVYLASAFFIISLALAVLIGHKNKQRDLIGKSETPAAEVQETAPETPTEEVQPKSLIEELPADENAAPEAPAIEITPAGEETIEPAPEAEPSAPAESPETAEPSAETAPEETAAEEAAGETAEGAPAEENGPAEETPEGQ